MPQKVRHYLGHFFGKKVKYAYAFKLECVELVLKKHFSDVLLIFYFISKV
jgi:hypothetical protein